MSASLLIVPPNEKYGRFVLNEVLEAGYGTSSGDLNTGGNLSESSFLEALFGLEFGHADFADFFLQLIYHPSRFTGRIRISYW